MLFENTTDRREAYRQTLLRLIEESDLLNARTLKATRRLVEQLQERILARFHRELRSGDAASQWGLYWIPQLIAAAEEMIAEFAAEFGVMLEGFDSESFALGMEYLNRPVEEATGLIMARPRITPIKLAVLARFRSDLVVAISEKTREQISKEVRINVATGESPDRLMRRLEGLVTTKGTPFRTVEARAETIARTEIAFAQSVGHEVRMRDVIVEHPQLTQGPRGMKHLFVSTQRGEYPCKICRPFDGQVYEINDPRKPIPPVDTHPNCRCQLVPYFPGLTPTARVPRPRFRRQSAVSLAESVLVVHQAQEFIASCFKEACGICCH